MQGLKLHFVHLYPDLMNLYGDRGNMVALAMRAKWRGISTEVREVSLGEKLQINKIDCIVMGGDRANRGFAKRPVEKFGNSLLCRKGILYLVAGSTLVVLSYGWGDIARAQLAGYGRCGKRMIGNIHQDQAGPLG